MLQPGTKIICINPIEKLVMHDVYIVEGNVNDGKVVKLYDFAGHYVIERFYVPNLQAGDEVVYIITSSTYPDFTLGKTYTINSIRKEDSSGSALAIIKNLPAVYTWRFLPLALYLKTTTCQDCNGTGIYVGFLAIEPCRTCKV